MSFLAPLWLAVAGVIGAGVTFAHLFSATVPPQDVLPTVRFIPEGTPLTVLRTRRITDGWLLLLRLVAVALLGLALAGAQVARHAPARVVLLDVSRAVGSPAAALDSAIAVASGAELIAFDSSARRLTPDSVRALDAAARGQLARSGARGSLSTAIVAAHRLLAETPDGTERTELVMVSPLAREEIDSATAHLLLLWQGPVRVVRVAALSDTTATTWNVRADGDDPVAAALGPAPRGRQESVRLVRTLPTPADSQWAKNTGGALVVWPAINERQTLEARAAADSQSGIAAVHLVAIAPFRRELQPRAGRVVVRWTDGEAAATERPLGKGCVREVAVPVDAVGDLALRDSFRGIVRSLLAPCGGARDFRPPPASLEALLKSADHRAAPGTSPRMQQRFAAAGRERGNPGSLPMWLALIAAGTLIFEQVLRARGGGRAAA